MARKEIIDTALTPDDTAPNMSPRGYPMMTPDWDESDMLEAMENMPPGDGHAELPPQEAYDLMKFTAPPSEEEMAILEEHPLLDQYMRWVDDPDSNEHVLSIAHKKYDGLDYVLEDEMYGEIDDDDDLGFSLSSLNPVKLAKKAVMAPLSLAARGARAVGSIANKFNPMRDRGKADLIRRTHARLWREHANWLRANDYSRGVNRTPDYYNSVSKQWSLNQLHSAGLPTSYVSGNKIATDILGGDAMGSWYNPLSWFSAKTNYVLVNTQGQRLAQFNQAQYDAYTAQQIAAQQQQAADPNAAAATAVPTSDPNSPSYDPTTDPNSPSYDPSATAPVPVDPNAAAYDPNAAAYDPNATPPYYDPSATQGDSAMSDETGKLYRSISDPLDGLNGDSSLGEFAAEILGDDDGVTASRENMSLDIQSELTSLKKKNELRAHNIEVLKNTRKAISSGHATAGDARAAATLAKQMGAEKAAKWFIQQGGNLPLGAPSVPGLSDAAVMGDWLYKLNPAYWVKSSKQQAFINQEHNAREKEEKLKEDNEYGERAATAAEAAQKAADEAASIDERLKSAHGQTVAAGEDPDELATPAFMQAKRAASGNRKQAEALLAKAENGQPFSAEDIEALKTCLRRGRRLKQAADVNGWGFSQFTTPQGRRIGPRRLARMQRKLALLQQSQAQGALSPQDAVHLQRLTAALAQAGVVSGVYHDTSGAAGATRPSAIKVASAIVSKAQAGNPQAQAAVRLATKVPLTNAEFFTQLKQQASAGDREAKVALKTLAAKPTRTSGEDSLGAGAAQELSKDTWIKLITLKTTNPAQFSAKAAANNISLTPQQTVHLNNMVALTKSAVVKQAAQRSKTSGAEVGLTFTSAIKDIGKAAVLPLAAVAYGTYGAARGVAQGTVAAKRKLFGGGPSASPVQQAEDRRLAALKRIHDARMKSMDAQQKIQAEADAAQAEFDAQQAEAQAQSLQKEAAESQYTSDEDAAAANASADTSGEFIAGKGSMIAKNNVAGRDSWLPPSDNTREIETMIGDFIVGKHKKAKLDPKTKKIVAAASKNDQTGKKIRAGARVYAAHKKGNKKATLAIAKVQAKAKKGDLQARRDYNAIKAGKVVVNAHHARTQRRLAYMNQQDRGIAARRKLENKAGDKLAQLSRQRRLAHIAKVERNAARGDRKAKAAISRQVALAHKGNKKAKTNVAALQLVKKVRLASKTPREAKDLKDAHKVIVHARRGNPKAIRTVKVVQAAAKAGNPNAKRAHERLKTAAALQKTIETGKVVLPVAAGAAGGALVATAIERKKNVQKTKAKVAAGTATREEALAAAKDAHALGDKETAADLAYQAPKLKSATEGIKNAAAVSAAAQNGNEQAAAAVKKTLDAAESGDPAGIKSAGNLAAVKELDNVQRGGQMSPEMAEATELVQRAQAGDPEAKRIAERVGQSAEAGEPDGVKAAIALSGAAAVMAAVAAKPKAKQQWIDKAKETNGTKLDSAEEQQAQGEFHDLYAKVQDGSATQDEALKARKLAMALDKPKLAAEITALMPPIDDYPLSSLPDSPQAPIRGMGSLVKESLRALLLATTDPIANYREGLRARSSAGLLPDIHTTSGKK